ncbi:flagellar basal body-associated FliL family protein [Salipiger mucosus]|uniref:Flagellar protein FliL n=1 Tax=Salipiger mucosus DSM 16094 TaxID=1123237 RepID=S9QSK1_9RHOB|nr:flagellar basal body-associated FliL family protein [Salipiger mucosus]EPX82623.1 hypothetical protein Salmuc_00942 [Salipiger mucosus DSM 16094]
MKKLLPILLALLGTGAGVGAGILLAPGQEQGAAEAEHSATEPGTGHETTGSHAAPESHDDGHGTPAETAFAKLSNQFIVPVVGADRISSLVVISISLEVVPAATETVYEREPKLRDSFLRVLFDHANIGGFEGNFTESHRMDLLGRALLETARSILGGDVIDVLITEIARQDA